MSDLRPIADPLARARWVRLLEGDPPDDASVSAFLGTVRSCARAVPAGADILLEGDHADGVIWVLSGWVSLSKCLPDGRRHLIDVLMPVDLIRPVAADGRTSAVTVSALASAVVSAYPIKRFRDQLAGLPRLHGMTDLLAAAGRARQAERMLRLARASACQRLAYCLLELFVRLEAAGRTRQGAFALPFRQKDLGDLAGLTSVHVCRTLQGLARDGMIRQTDQAIRIEDVDGLAALAGIAVETLRQEILPPGFGTVV